MKKNKMSLTTELDLTREGTAEMTRWCILIALHQSFGVGAGGALGGFCGFGGDVLGRLVDALFGSGGVLGGIGHGVSVLTARSFAIYYK